MPESTKRLTTEEIWATALAVIGGLAVLLPLIVFALSSQRADNAGGRLPESPPALATGNPETMGGEEKPPISAQPIPSSPSALRKELVEARSQIDALSDALDVAKTNAEASERSAKRAWIQLREAAGEVEGESGESEPVETTNPG